MIDAGQIQADYLVTCTLNLHLRAEMRALLLATVPEKNTSWIQAASVSMGSCTSLEKDHVQTLPEVPISSRGIIRRSRLLWEYQDFPHRTNQNPLRKSTKQNSVLKRPINWAVS